MGEGLWGVVGGIIGLLTIAARWSYGRYVTSTSADAIVKTTIAIYEALEDCRTAIGADRCVLVAVHNGVGIPEAGCDLKASMRNEVCRDGVKPLRDSWESINVDAGYARLLRDLHVLPVVLTRTEMAVGVLKSLYEAGHIRRSLVGAVSLRDGWHGGSIIPKRRRYWMWLTAHFSTNADPTVEQRLVFAEYQRRLQRIVATSARGWQPGWS